MNEPLPRGSETSLVLTHLTQPADANYMGNIHGGIIMKLIDEAAGACAFRFCRTTIVTAAIDRIDFHHPVRVGNLVRFMANVNFAGTQVGRGRRARRGRGPDDGDHDPHQLRVPGVRGAQRQRQADPGAQLVPQTDQQKEWYAEAEERRRKRLAEREPAD